MKAVIQRCSNAKLEIDNTDYGSINQGLVVFIAFNSTDTVERIKWMCNKIANLRIFSDDEGKMNKSVLDISGEILVISNFTLYGDCKKGFRPNFMSAAPPESAEQMYDFFIKHLKESYPIKIVQGVFGAMMNITLNNDGPVTIILEKEF
jgi:D-aminoacyl-tRNA deacylase